MATKRPDGSFIIAAGEAGAFTVCPMAWKLKWIDKERGISEGRQTSLGQQLHRDWSAIFDEAVVFGKWIRYVAVLLCTAVVLFLLLRPVEAPLKRLFDLSASSNLFELLLIVGASLIVIRSFRKAATQRKSDAGFEKSGVTVSVDGSATLPAREYISTTQGLAGQPDALIVEEGAILPVERKPLAKKLRDRYVAQLLVYMRLVEEFEGVKPPYGYLLLGPTCRRVKIQNSPERQAWLERHLNEMREILRGAAPKPAPHPIKCAKCDVRHKCSARADEHGKNGGSESSDRAPQERRAPESPARPTGPPDSTEQ